MRAAALSPAVCGVLAAIALTGCREKTSGDAVRAAYDNHAEAIDREAAAQPTATAQKIYKARADAIREEGRDREKGLEGGTPSRGQGDAAAGGGSSK